jgi:hypothetical protein
MTTGGTIDFYVASLPARIEDDRNREAGVDNPFMQCCVYADKVHPIKDVEKTVIVGGEERERRPKVLLNDTYTLWSIITRLLDCSHLLGNPSMQRCNVRFVTDALKAYCSEQTIHTFMTGRRIYPLMEMLDKPKVEFEKKHQAAIGHFLSFLLDKAVTINNMSYRWTTECAPSDIHIAVKNDGFWQLV